MKVFTRMIAIGVVFTLFSFTDIVRCHNKSDEDYLQFGEQFPSVCKVGKSLGDGTLIADRWVLTAAHVAEAFVEIDDSRKVYFGKSAYKIESITLHPGYQQPMQGHDIALIKLKQAPKDVIPTPLYTASDESGQDIVIVGHGYAKAGNARTWESKDRKKRAATNRVERTTQDHIVFNFSHPDSNTTTRLEGTAGPGDSGGPALIDQGGTYYIAGVSSAGFDGRLGPGTYGAVEHYTRVSTHLDWIKEVLATEN